MNFDFSKSEYNFFIENCNFINQEKEVFTLSRQGFSILEISLKLNISTATVSRRIYSIKKKIMHEIFKN